MNVLVVAAHPDDEVLGCGGTIARHAAKGDLVHLLILAEGATSRDCVREPLACSADILALRESALAAAATLGAKEPQFGELPDNRLDTVPLLEVVKLVERVVHEVRPEIVYTHYRSDLNVDHRVAFNAVVTACRPLPGSPVRTVCSFETASSTEWSPDVFAPTLYVDISEFMDVKMRALKCYMAELRPFPHPRSLQGIAALARLRGANIGAKEAEAFSIVREIVR